MKKGRRSRWASKQALPGRWQPNPCRVTMRPFRGASYRLTARLRTDCSAVRHRAMGQKPVHVLGFADLEWTLRARCSSSKQQ